MISIAIATLAAVEDIIVIAVCSNRRSARRRRRGQDLWHTLDVERSWVQVSPIAMAWHDS